MNRRPRLPVYSASLTDRQREVLALVARGKTNPEIASALGITLETVKYHVTEILTRLNVSTREEAAAAWNAERTVGARLRALVPSFGGHAAMAAGGVALVVLVAFAVLLVLRTGDDGSPSPTNPPENETPSATTTVTATTTASPSATAPAPSATASPGERVTGIAEVDSVLAVIRSGDANAIEQIMEPQDLACTTRVGLGGPPKCPDGVADGTVVTVFPSSASSLVWSFDWDVHAQFLASVTEVVAVYRADYMPYDPAVDRIPSGSYVAIVQPLRLVHIHNGRIVYLSLGGYSPLEDLIARVPPGDFVLPPP